MDKQLKKLNDAIDKLIIEGKIASDEYNRLMALHTSIRKGERELKPLFRSRPIRWTSTPTYLNVSVRLL